MSLSELMPLVENLSLADKKRLFDSLAEQLAAQGAFAYDKGYTTQSFRENAEAAQILMDYLHQEKDALHAKR